MKCCWNTKSPSTRYRFTEAEWVLHLAIELTLTLDDQALLASQVGDLGNMLRAQGRSTEAACCYEETLQLTKTLEDLRGQQLSLGTWALSTRSVVNSAGFGSISIKESGL
jgi:hypothetical protein